MEDRKNTVLVTGANGMLAANIIERLLHEGYAVVGTLRRGKSYPGERSGRLKIVEADFKDASAMGSLVSGCGRVIHVAAMTSQSCPDYEQYRKVNAEASRRLAEIAAGSGVERFVYVSTANTIGFGSDESQPMRYPFSESFYARSKKEAEDALLPLADRMDIVVVNPTFMIGKYGSGKGSNRVFSMVKKSPVLVCPSGGKNVIDVAEAARGMVMAMEGGRNGEKYLICGENYTYEELFRAIAAHQGRRRCFLRLPDFLLKAAGALGDLLARCGMKVEFGSVNMKILMIKNYYDTDKAFRDFGFRPGSLFGDGHNS